MDCCYIGIDLGSTTTKAVFLDEHERIMGRGITNSRSNYELACQVAREEAEINARFGLLRRTLEASERIGELAEPLMAVLACNHALAQHLEQLQALDAECRACAQAHDLPATEQAGIEQALARIFAALRTQAELDFFPGSAAASDFFRDLATSHYLQQAEQVTRELPVSFDRLVGLFDAAIIRVENHSFAGLYREYLAFATRRALADARFAPFADEIAAAVGETAERRFNVLNTVGTGYGRLTLPFAREQIRSEILCHGLGAHYMFPDTRTVLDIGGQDTKAIQVDGDGIVTGFQMNDRCAAGCGRYLGYIADEMSIGVHELGPLALQSTKPVKINSTCTVFAGAELRELMALGEKREDILAGLHRAIVLRAMSLLARSGGVESEFTFTGGVARNQAVTGALEHLVFENYGKMTINISADSIFTGAVGAALFAKRDPKGVMSDLEVSKLPGSKACGLAAACPA
ncbi:BadF/BadG/BcrA/BcrD ATPase family protein [Thermomonas sp.]|uniref:BadF/BadG/BcrA/BcrD ATPase family protein n=1 Tax=Thermomonas sp. TaxID=1971895 RepID=UPI001EB2D880|nr:BadF/BadG/BcrA/BcrD ATPase family protein [Thermomonas sp.]MBK6416324.1 benzoyl-CoA reductase subunit A [Thermomonas sp.]